MQESRSARQISSAHPASRLPPGSCSRDSRGRRPDLARAVTAPAINNRSLTAVPEGRATWQDDDDAVGTDNDQGIRVTVPDVASLDAEAPLSGCGKDAKTLEKNRARKTVTNGDEQQTAVEPESDGVYEWLDYFNYN